MASRLSLQQHPLLPKVSGLGVSKNLGVERARTANSNCPKGYPVPCDVVYSNKTGEKEEEEVTFVVMVLVFQEQLLRVVRPCF